MTTEGWKRAVGGCRTTTTIVEADPTTWEGCRTREAEVRAFKDEATKTSVGAIGAMGGTTSSSWEEPTDIEFVAITVKWSIIAFFH